MINSFKIENFKGFRELELPELSRITLLGGSNNVGKTSVLEAIFTFFDRYNPQMLFKQLAMRGVETVPLEPDSLWQPAFHNFDMSQPIVLSGSIDSVPERLEIRFSPFQLIQTIPANLPATEGQTPTINAAAPPVMTAALEIRYTVAGQTEQKIHLTLGRNGMQIAVDTNDFLVPPVALVVGRRLSDPNSLASMFGKLDIVGKQGIAVEFLRVIEPALKSLSVITNGNAPIIYGDIGLPRKIPIAYMGDGVQRLLSLILHIATHENGTVLFDEIENGLHHSVMAQVWEGIAKAAQEFNCQIIATTHSFECLQGALTGLGEVCMNDFSYIRLDRIGDKIVPKRLDYSMLETALEFNMEIR